MAAYVALGLVGIIGLSVESAAAVVVLDPTATLSVYDTGGMLNSGTNGGFYLGGLEVDPAGGAVYASAHNVIPGGMSSQLRLIKSTGPGTAILDSSGAFPLRQTTRGVDLTYLNGKYYVAAMDLSAASLGGIYGITPGAAGLTTFAAGPGIPRWATSGLTFDAAGTTALVTSDGPIGHHSVAAGAITSTNLVSSSSLPTGFGRPADDHVVTKDGRTIVITDSSAQLMDVTGGPGTVTELFNLAPLGGTVGVGSRGVVDPVSGDIFAAMGDSGGKRIFRVKADGSSGIIFADGFTGDGVRDLAFGLSSDGSGTMSLYAAETFGGIGTIYEFKTVPEPSTLTLLCLGAFALLGIGRRRGR